MVNKDGIYLGDLIAELSKRLGFEEGNVKRITLEPTKATVLAFDVTPNGSKYIQIPPLGTSDYAALFERTFEIRS